MNKTILLTGATDGIGLATASMLLSQGHNVLLHGRSQEKLDTVAESLSHLPGQIELYRADLSRLDEVKAMAAAVLEKHRSLDALINNAGVFKIASPITDGGLDVRVVVNILAPLALTKMLLPALGSTGRVVNLSSAAQAPVELSGLTGEKAYSDAMAAYAQSKLAITMWTHALAEQLGAEGPILISVNPGSMLGSKMVKEAFGVAGGDINIGADILARAALSDEFSNASGKYYDNDSKRFSTPHPDALDANKVKAVMQTIEKMIN